jgi:hypothetical protein
LIDLNFNIFYITRRARKFLLNIYKRRKLETLILFKIHQREKVGELGGVHQGIKVIMDVKDGEGVAV